MSKSREFALKSLFTGIVLGRKIGNQSIKVSKVVAKETKSFSLDAFAVAKAAWNVHIPSNSDQKLLK